MKINKLKYLKRGFSKKCPSCGKSPIFLKYIKTHKICKKCGLKFSDYKSDDGPAYCTIFVVGHILIPLILLTEKKFSPEINFQLIFWPFLTVFLSLWLLPKIKGAFIAFQIFVDDKQS
ncbi:MAG: DUF983 domain-containing protein [Alphaproteobacteria bacterium]